MTESPAPPERQPPPAGPAARAARRPAWARRARWPRGQAADAMFAVAVMAATLVMSVQAERPEDRALWPGGFAIIVVATLALAVRRRYPVAVLVVGTIAPPVYYPLGYPDGPIALVLWVALFTAAAERRLAVSLGAVIVVNAGFVIVSVARGGEDGGDPEAVVDARGVASLSLGLLLAVALGQYVRTRHLRAVAAERRAAEAERTREEEARRRAIAERLRIARELHDVLAHQISLINVQAGAALHRRDDPARAYAALEAIKSASKETLRELRGVLGVLRQVDADDTGGAGGGPAAPQPSLARVVELLEQTAAAGVTVRRAGDLADPEPADPEPADPDHPEHPEHSDQPDHPDSADPGAGGRERGVRALAELPAPVGLAGYRIVQEALTNAVRHSGAATVTVEVRRVPGAVIVQIDDDGPGPADPADPGGSGGNGLRGMRERAASVGGEMTAGPGPAGGFRVWARLPLGGPGEEQEQREGIA
ncbi:sensor histidine kinase [Actinomadura sp. KC06]|uniref:sensor histidine kinase n=1 Tax=Actinomadura sp. KC06 TaxID=2530369 RepID=UPI00104E9C8E|nr:sensor histidine kinase [Actinomadura sp. KC06]TDD21978.1 sensor histidine kinase [Actinomadura sp. KC06]